jgi:uncharacterized membrane protein
MIAWLMDPARRRLRQGLLAISVALNLFVVGLAIGYAVTHGPFAREAPRERSILDFELRAYGLALPEAERDAVRARVEEIAPLVRERRARLREIRAEIAAMLVAPDPDRGAIEDRLVEIRRITSETQALVQERALESLLALPDPIRQGLEREPARRPR